MDAIVGAARGPELFVWWGWVGCWKRSQEFASHSIIHAVEHDLRPRE